MTDENKTAQSKADDKRRENHFQVRTDPETGDKLRHFLKSRRYSANEGLNIILRRFFGGHGHD